MDSHEFKSRLSDKPSIQEELAQNTSSMCSDPFGFYDRKSAKKKRSKKRKKKLKKAIKICETLMINNKELSHKVDFLSAELSKFKQQEENRILEKMAESNDKDVRRMLLKEYKSIT